MGQHPDFLYMREPRYIWRDVEPRLNVWRGHPTQGVLYWDDDDVNERVRHSLARWFHLALALSRRRRLIEKMPLNVFRMTWLAASFPQAKFIHVIRHGRDVALSMQQAVEKRWFSTERGYPEGYWQSSWNYLIFEQYAEDNPELCDRLPFVRESTDNYVRSLFVWLCCVWTGHQAGTQLGDDRYIEVRYEDLVQKPAVELNRVLGFLGESSCSAMIDHANSVLHGGSIRKSDPNPEATHRIAGAMLHELGYEV